MNDAQMMALFDRIQRRLNVELNGNAKSEGPWTWCMVGFYVDPKGGAAQIGFIANTQDSTVLAAILSDVAMRVQGLDIDREMTEARNATQN